MMTEYITKKPLSLQYMMYPKFLLETDLNETARLVYILLLDRARLSQTNGWVDGYGRVYVIYTISELAKTIGKGRTTVKGALSALENSGLIKRHSQEYGKPNHIFVRIPVSQLTGSEY